MPGIATWTRRLIAALVLGGGLLVALLLTSSSASATSLDSETRSPDAARIATGVGFSCAIDDGFVQCWGSGDYGELGTGNATDSNRPVAVALGDGRTAIQVVAGAHHACVLLGDGSVRCWGRNNHGQLGYGKSVTDTNGGPDAPGNPSKTPAALGAVSLGRTAIAISAGGDNTCALLNNGRIRCWGAGGGGQDGSGHPDDIGDDEKPSDVPAIDVSNEAIAVTTGNNHSCALLDDGTVRCWGHGAYGELGYGSNGSIGRDNSAGSGGAVALGGPAVAISAGGDDTCAVLGTGEVRCWGSGAFGELGGGNTDDVGLSNKPVDVPVVSLGAGRTAISVTAGTDHTCALLDNGTLRCWGAGVDGRLGYGNMDNIGDDELPSDAPGLVDVGGSVVAVSAGGSQTCARLGDGTIHCWGAGARGQLGYGDTKNVGDGVNGDATPASAGAVDTGATPEVRQVAAGTAHTCALASDGTVRCWGHGSSGQLGYGNTNDVGNSPNDLPSAVGTVDVGGSVKAIAAGGDHTCALRADGQVYCWGDGEHGELGYGNTANVGDGKNGDKKPLSAGPVSLGRTAVAVVAGDMHTCAILSGGVVRCWGNGAYGELGGGNTHDIGDDELPSAAPGVPVGGTVRALSAGLSGTCAILAKGDSRCWGNDDSDQLGYGNTNNLGDDETPDKADPISLGAGRRAVGFAQGFQHTCVALDDGTMRCWGASPQGELGHGNTNSYLGKAADAGPVWLSADSSRYSRLVDAGQTHTCVVMDDGQLRCWGFNPDGRLGTGNTDDVGDTEVPAQVDPVNVGDGRRVVSIGLGAAHTCAVLDDGTLRCWGYGSNGRLGTGSTADVGDTAADVPGKVDAVHVFDVLPVAVDDTLTVLQDAAATSIDVLANDTDPDGGPKIIASVTAPDHGAAAITGGTAVSYRPDAGFCGADSFSYTLNGGAQATVAVTVLCPVGVGAPTGVAGVASADHTGVEVSWTAPEELGTPALTGYAVTVTDEGSYPDGSGAAASVTQRFDSTDTHQAITGLVPGHRYVFQVAGYVRDGEGVADGALSDPSAVVVTASVPSAPTDLSATAGDGTVELSWAAPSDGGGLPPSGYLVYRSDSVPGAWTLLTSGPSGLPTTESFTDDSVVNGHTYFYAVSAVNALGESAMSSSPQAVTPSEPTTTTVVADPSPAQIGTPVTWTATVDPAPGGGTVAFVDTGTAVPGCSAVPVVTGGGVGRATCTTFYDAVGERHMVATFSGSTVFAASASDPVTETVGKEDQTITFAAPANVTYGDPDVALTPAPSASSDLPVSVVSWTPGVCTVVAGKVHVVHAGSCTLIASQAGDDSWSAAPDQSVSFTIGKAALTVTAPDASMSFGGAPPTVAPSYAGFASGDGAGVLDTAPTCMADPDTLVTSCSGGVDGDYAFSYIDGHLTVNDGDQSIAFPAPSGVAYGDGDFASGASASSGLPVSVASSTPGVCTVVGGEVHVVHAGSCTLIASQAGDDDWNAAPDVSASFMIGKAALMVTAPDASMVSGDSPPTVVPSYDGFVGADTAADLDTAPTCVADPETSTTSCSGGVDGDYAFTYADGHLSVNPADQQVHLAAPAVVSYAQASVPITATSDSGGPVELSATPARVCTVSGSTLAIHAAGTCTITGAQAGDVGHNPAQAVLTVTVHPVALKVTAASGSAVVKGKLPKVAALFSGFVRGDSVFSLDRQPSCKAVRGKVRHVKRHGKKVTVAKAGHTVCSGVKSGNYAVSYRSGRLAVAKNGYAVTSPSRFYLRGGVRAVVKLSAVAKKKCTYKVTGKLPAGLRWVHPKSWSKVSIAGTPTAHGVKKLKIVLRSGKHAMAKQKLTLEID